MKTSSANPRLIEAFKIAQPLPLPREVRPGGCAAPLAFSSKQVRLDGGSVQPIPCAANQLLAPQTLRLNQAA